MNKAHVHFLGILGSGASAAAKIAEAQGFQVSGCDKEIKGHSPKHLYCHPERSEGSLANASQNKSGDSSLITQNDSLIDILAVTPAIFSLDPQNPELLEAKKLNIPIMTWQEFMGKFLQKHKYIIAVAGTHGKSTTTAMIGQMLEDAGLDPTVELGADIPYWGANFRIGEGGYFICEADEYNDNFLNFHPDIAVVTNIEMDHPEYFKDFEEYKKSFDKFNAQSKKVFDKPDPKLINFSLQVPGDFNILNASLAYQIGLELGIKKEIIKKSLQNYTGTSRRFEYLGDFKGSKIYTDFGHHPTEIKVTMEAARQKFPGSKILLIFEPHMFTRTYKLFDDFVKVFKTLPVDQIIITDIYQSREVDKGFVNSKQLVDAINKKNAIYIPKKELKNSLEKEIKVMDVIFFMGAGDIDKIARNIIQKKVLILGLGLNEGGVGSAKFFAMQGAQVKVTDLKTKKELKKSLDQLKTCLPAGRFKNIEYTLGKHKYEDIDWANLIIRNPALKLNNPYLKYARKKGKQIEMDMGIFLQYVRPDQIIGVTGTKGKSTTASLIYEIFKKTRPERSRRVIFAGNIGKSVLDATAQITKDSLIVLELSSFQLQAFRKHQVSPKWGVITNIFPDHLNYYQNMEDYINDKKAISEFQTKEDFLFVKKDSLFSTKGKTIYFSKKDLPDDYKPKLMGEHNLENIAAALAVVKQFGIDKKIALKIMGNFQGVEFRLQLTKTWQGVKIYNDSAATNPGATIQALNSLPNCILIVGGVNKNLSYDDLASAIKKYAKKVYFLEGSATEEILKIKNLRQRRISLWLKKAKIYNNLEKVLRDIRKVVKPGDIILFSPAAASFNLFQNEFDRGRKFNEAIRKVFK